MKRSGHRPDLVGFLPDGKPVTIEVELVAKSRSRLGAILGVHRGWSYTKNSKGVVYICGDEAAQRRIERAGKRARLYLEDAFLRIELRDTIKEQARGVRAGSGRERGNGRMIDGHTAAVGVSPDPAVPLMREEEVSGSGRVPLAVTRYCGLEASS